MNRLAVSISAMPEIIIVKFITMPASHLLFSRNKCVKVKLLNRQLFIEKIKHLNLCKKNTIKAEDIALLC